MTGQLELSVKLLKLKIPYKYVVFTEKSQTKEDGCYEFIRLVENRHEGDPNRVFNLSERAIKQAIDEGINVINTTMHVCIQHCRCVPSV